jgi:DNA-binding response OmpR family regulator
MRVLVVEDDLELAAVIRRGLARAGSAIVETSAGPQATASKTGPP